MRRVIVTGARTWTDMKTVYNTLTDEWLDHGDFVLVHGACPSGADKFAHEWALWAQVYPNFNVSIETFPADWSLGKKAGPIRNQMMVDAGANRMFAFPMEDSVGTLGCIEMAKKAGIQVIVIKENPKNKNWMAEGKKSK